MQCCPYRMRLHWSVNVETATTTSLTCVYKCTINIRSTADSCPPALDHFRATRPGRRLTCNIWIHWLLYFPFETKQQCKSDKVMQKTVFVVDALNEHLVWNLRTVKTNTDEGGVVKNCVRQMYKSLRLLFRRKKYITYVICIIYKKYIFISNNLL